MIVTATPDVRPSITDAPSLAKQIRRSDRMSSVKPCRFRQVNGAVAIEQLFVVCNSTRSRKNVVGKPTTTVFKETASAV